MTLTITNCAVRPVDALTERIALLARLQDGWEMRPGFAGGIWDAPSAQAVSIIWAATQQLTDSDRAKLSASPHGDGYVNIEWNVGPIWWAAEVWPEQIIYAVNDLDGDDAGDREWSGQLDADELAAFLKLPLP